MKNTLLFVLAMWVSLVGRSQSVVSGTVMCDGEPVDGASVTEVDVDNRILNFASTDASGHYSMSLKSGKNVLKIAKDGCRVFVEDIRGRSRIDCSLVPQMVFVDEEELMVRHPVAESYKLLFGHDANYHDVPQLIRVELFNDSTFSIIVPVMSRTLTDAYPAENTMTFVDYSDHPLLTGVSMLEVYTIPGRPEDRESSSVIARRESRMDTALDDGSVMYCYPQFVFSVKRLERMLQDKEKQPYRVLIQTAAQDNFWVLYPSETFAKEIRKIIAKLQQKNRKKQEKAKR